MSNGRQATDAPHWPLVRITRLWDVLQRAKHWNELCDWFFHHAGSGRCAMYLPVPKGYFVRCSAHPTFDFGVGASTRHAERPPLPEIGMPLQEVKFLRLSPLTVEKVARHAASKSMFQQAPIREDRFLGGLSMSERPRDEFGPYEELPVALELRIKSANLETTNAWDSIDISPDQVFVADSVYDHIRVLLVDTPTAAVDPTSQVPNPASAGPTHEAQEGSTAALDTDDAPSAAADADPRGDAIDTNDPYGLRGRADGVYALYRTAERCARNASFLEEDNSKDRREIAHGVFSQLLDELASGSGDDRQLQRKLRRFFGSARLGHALRLIDPEYHLNDGRPTIEHVEEWPTAEGRAWLDQPDARRPAFVGKRPMLALMIGGAEHRLAWMKAPPAEEKAMPQALKQWLEAHGVISPTALATSFEVIAWNGHRIPHLPGSD